MSDKIATLSPKSLSLFCLLIPHFDPHGKMNGDPNYIKGLVCPKIKWLTVSEITKCLKEISNLTNVKWFLSNGIHYLHSLNWSTHQPGLRNTSKLPKNSLPEYSDSLSDSPSIAYPIAPLNKVKVLGIGIGLGEGKGEGIDKDRLKEAYGEFDNVFLTLDEFAKLDEKLKGSLENLIQELSQGIASKGYKYKDHYATLLSWARRKGIGHVESRIIP